MNIENKFDVGEVVEIIIPGIEGHVTAIGIGDGNVIYYEVTYCLGDYIYHYNFSDYQLKKVLK